MTFVSYAQNFEDVLLWRALGHVPAGFYIDVGAAHPDIDSVTRAFYDRGWHGINVEPEPEFARRLRAARRRDVTLAVAAADRSGQSTLHVAPGTGLSSLLGNLADRYAGEGREVRAHPVELCTVAEICRAHAPDTIHFLKIDAEGSERAVLAGCDFAAFRPWIVLIEATAPMSTTPTHAEWEDLLLAADYRFLWFDGLNRFYAAAERHAEIAPHFRLPVNVFDDFVRVADTEWARCIHEAETRAAVSEQRALGAEQRATEAADATEQARLLALARATEIQNLRDALGHERAATEHLDRAAREARHQVAALRASTSWRVTAPMRAGVSLLRRARSAPPAIPIAPPPLAAPEAAPIRPAPIPFTPARRPIAAVHQFHPGSAVGDAITNAMLLTRDILRNLGYRSEIYVAHVEPQLAKELRPIEELPLHADHVLLLRFSLGFDGLERVLRSAAPKILFYHNITPPALLATAPELLHYAELGRRQLAELPPHVVAALADSEFNATELRALGFARARACTLLFDVATLLRRAATRPARRVGQPFTVLFVGRVVESKGQADLVDAYARFREGFGGSARLVLVGRSDGGGAYAEQVRARIRAAGLEPEVTLAGLVSDAALHEWYCAADLYVSLSRHEGFGVPLVEAMAYDVPVLAWPCGAVPYTLGAGAALLHERTPEHVAAAMLGLARDPEARTAARERQRAALAQFQLDRQAPILAEALALAGASPPPPPEVRAALGANARFTIAGHVAKSYSLAAINRDLALAIEAKRPGTVRVLPVEGVPTNDFAEVPPERRSAIEALAAREKPCTGPAFVVSQHYPVWVPPEPEDAALALFYWEESVVPADTVALLNRSFRAVLAPSRFVAKALIDSGVSLPVRVIGHAPDLAPWRALAGRRAARGPTEAPFTFLHVSSGFLRKGIDALLAAWVRAFRRGDPVRLVVKCFPNPHNDAAEQIERLHARHPDAAEIVLVDRDIAAPELLDLYGAADAIVLPTRGEGFNLPAAEAMAAGIPLIVTGHGGHCDFCTPANVRLVDYRFAPSASHLASAHSVWAEPDVDDLAAALREALATRDPSADAARGWAERTRRARADIAAATAPGAVVARLAAAAVDAHLAPPAPAPAPLRFAWVSSWDVRCGIAEYSGCLLDDMRRAAPDEAWTIFADTRTEAARDPDNRVCRAWRLGDIGELATALAAADPDIIVVQHQPGLFGWDALARLVLAPSLGRAIVVATLHNTRHLAAIASEQRAPAIHALSRLARVLVHTVGDLNTLRQLGLTDNVTLLPHGARPAREAPPARTLAPADAPLIGSYGFFLPDKGLPQLIEALARLRAAWPRVRLRLVNAEYETAASAAEIAACRRLAATLGLAEAVEFVTDFLPPERSLDLLGACDLVVLPYQASLEASSAALRGALGAGVPLAVTPLPLFEEAAEATIRLSGTDPAALAAGIDQALRDRGLRRAVQRAARSWLHERDWSTIATRLLGMLRGLAASRGLTPPQPGG